jgi:hypothetical protein
LIERIISGNVNAYSNERLRAGASALRMIKAQTLLVTSSNPLAHWLRQSVVPALLRLSAVNRYLVARMLGIGYN